MPRIIIYYSSLERTRFYPRIEVSVTLGGEPEDAVTIERGELFEWARDRDETAKVLLKSLGDKTFTRTVKPGYKYTVYDDGIGEGILIKE